MLLLRPPYYELTHSLTSSLQGEVRDPATGRRLTSWFDKVHKRIDSPGGNDFEKPKMAMVQKHLPGLVMAPKYGPKVKPPKDALRPRSRTPSKRTR